MPHIKRLRATPRWKLLRKGGRGSALWGRFGEPCAAYLGGLGDGSGVPVALAICLPDPANVIGGLFAMAHSAQNPRIAQHWLPAKGIRQDVIDLGLTDLETGAACLAAASGAEDGLGFDLPGEVAAAH